MSTPLTAEEKNSVIEIMESIYGYDSSLVVQKNSINQQTVEALEETFATLEKCNSQMKELVVSLIGASALANKGWLRLALKSVASTLKNDKLKFQGIACRSVVGASRKSIIYSTLY